VARQAGDALAELLAAEPVALVRLETQTGYATAHSQLLG